MLKQSSGKPSEVKPEKICRTQCSLFWTSGSSELYLWTVLMCILIFNCVLFRKLSGWKVSNRTGYTSCYCFSYDSQTSDLIHINSIIWSNSDLFLGYLLWKWSAVFSPLCWVWSIKQSQRFSRHSLQSFYTVHKVPCLHFFKGCWYIRGTLCMLL